jgi:hypothetical protein
MLECKVLQCNLFFQEFNVSFYFTARTKHATNLQNSECIVFPFIIWFYGSAIVIIRGWGCGFGNRREDVVAWSDNRQQTFYSPRICGGSCPLSRYLSP